MPEANGSSTEIEAGAGSILVKPLTRHQLDEWQITLTREQATLAEMVKDYERQAGNLHLVLQSRRIPVRRCDRVLHLIP